MRPLAAYVRIGLVLAVHAAPGVLAPGVLIAQPDSSGVAGATLRGWAERARLRLFDRGGSFHGRTSDRGVLQRFNERMDAEYTLDILSARFSPVEDADWYRRRGGARFWAGSIDHLNVVQEAEVRGSVPLGSSWAADLAFTQQETLETDRSLVRLGLRRRVLGRRGWVFIEGSLQSEKPESDLELGLAWRGPALTITVAVAALDAFSDIVYQTLEVDPAISDSALDYTSHPFTGRFALDLRLSDVLRVEAYGLVLTPTHVVVAPQAAPQAGFGQDERYGHLGGAVEWAAAPATLLGVFATWVRARTGRTPRAFDPGAEEFDLVEKTWRLGIYGIHSFAGRLSAEGWFGRLWRSEVRRRPAGATLPSTRYRDRAWVGRLGAVHRARSGFRAEAAVDLVLRETSGPLPVATLEPLESEDTRLRIDLGWVFGDRAVFVVGAGFDMDNFARARGNTFDGAHGRFGLYW